MGTVLIDCLASNRIAMRDDRKEWKPKAVVRAAGVSFLVKEHCGAEGTPLNVLPGRGKEERFKRRIGLIIVSFFLITTRQSLIVHSLGRKEVTRL